MADNTKDRDKKGSADDTSEREGNASVATDDSNTDSEPSNRANGAWDDR